MSKNIRHHIIVANKVPKTFRKIPENLGCQFLTLIWFLNICYHNIVNIDHKYLGRDTKDEYLANSNNSLAKKGQPPLGGASWEHLDYHFSFYVYIFHYPCVALVEKTWIMISHFPMCGLNHYNSNNDNNTNNTNIIIFGNLEPAAGTRARRTKEHSQPEPLDFILK